MRELSISEDLLTKILDDILYDIEHKKHSYKAAIRYLTQAKKLANYDTFVTSSLADSLKAKKDYKKPSEY
jgi:uncharacterized protein VirK/YbjX